MAGRSTCHGAIADRAILHIDNATTCLPWMRSTVVKTNVIVAHGVPRLRWTAGMIVIEEILDRIARQTDCAEVVRERNLYHGTGETNTTHYGQLIEDNRSSVFGMN